LKDTTLLNDIPADIRIHKTISLDIDGLRNIRHGIIVDGKSNTNRRIISKSLFEKALNKVLNTYLLLPDNKVGWIPHTVWKAYQVLKHEKINTVCTTSPPHSTHIIGTLLKRLIDFNWVVDFRDPWMFSFMKKPLYQSLHYREKLESSLERIVIRRADRVIFVTEGVKNAYLEKYGDLLNGKQLVITNGYDEPDFSSHKNVQTRELNPKFIMTYVGIIYPGKSRTFLKAMKKLIDKTPSFKQNSILRFAGPSSPENISLINELKLDHYVELMGFRNHYQIISDMINSDLLILLVGDEKHWIPGKLFEYIRSKRPILVVGTEGDAAKIAEKSGLGIRVSHHDESEIRRKVYELYQNAQNGSLKVKPDETYIKGFQRKELTYRFAQALNAVSGYRLQKSN
jgi:glycosyltransferase involved in cell wall biosynthesis